MGLKNCSVLLIFFINLYMLLYFSILMCEYNTTCPVIVDALPNNAIIIYNYSILVYFSTTNIMLKFPYSHPFYSKFHILMNYISSVSENFDLVPHPNQCNLITSDLLSNLKTIFIHYKMLCICCSLHTKLHFT